MRDAIAETINATERTSVKSKPHGGITRLIILDRRAFIRECIASFLRRLSRNMETSRATGSAEDLRAEELAQADIVILGTNVPPATLEHEITLLLFRRRDLPIMLIADIDDTDEVSDLVARWGLRGYIPMSSSLADAEAALHIALAGLTYLPRGAANDSMHSTRSADVRTNGGANDGPRLTLREQSVLLLLREGMPNKIIAHRLGISQSTVKAHIHSILTKLHSSNRTQAAMHPAVMAGEISVPALPSEKSVSTG